MSIEAQFLKFSVDKLIQFTGRIDVCLGKLTGEQVWARASQNENAVGNLVLHLNGNVRQWIVSALGNNPGARDRDAEFEARGGSSTADLMAALRETVERAVAVISCADADSLVRMYDIQGYSVSGVEVIYHVVEHFAEHTGQIIFATKMLTGGDLGFYGHLRKSGAASAVGSEPLP